MKRFTTLALAALAALTVAACGGDGEGIPQDTAAALRSEFDQIEQKIPNCGSPAGNFSTVQQLIDSLPDDVDADVRDTLEDGVDRLAQLFEDECAGVEEDDETDTEETETVPETTAPPTETVPPETVPEETVPEETVPEETIPEEPPADGGTPPGNGNGNGPKELEKGQGGL